MAERQVTTTGRDPHQQQKQGHHVSGKTVLLASLAGVAAAGPLLGMMGFSFLASLTLLLISSPLLIIFSPLLLCAAFVLAAAVAGFVIAATMAIAGFCTLAWTFRSFRRKGSVDVSGGGVKEKLEGSGEKLVKEQGKDWAGYLLQKAQGSNPTENSGTRG